jgi:hypothetical protein
VVQGNRLVSRTDAIGLSQVTDALVKDNVARLIGPSCGDPVGLRTVGTQDVVATGNRFTGYRADTADG